MFSDYLKCVEKGSSNYFYLVCREIELFSKKKKLVKNNLKKIKSYFLCWSNIIFHFTHFF